MSGSSLTITAGSGVGMKILGTGDIVVAGLNDALIDGGSSTLFKIGGRVGALSIAGFGADLAGGVDLLGGAGGYASAAAAASTLTSDGHGGSLLALGAAGSIDFAGVAPSAMHASNFKIG